MKTTDYLKNKYIKGSLLVIAGLLLGWLFFHQSEPVTKTETIQAEEHHHAEKETIWTCSMHPQIRQDKPGKCPICGMDLIPLAGSNAAVDEQAVQMSESAMKLAEVQTSMVTKGTAEKDLQLYGKIQVNERLLQSQTAHISGRIEQLLANTTGESIKEGQLIARIYSPELVSAQKELLEALSLKDQYPKLAEAAREKLRNWKLTDEQIAAIEQSGKVSSTFDLCATTSGTVLNRKVSEGDYVKNGAVLFDIADLSEVWAVFDAYETDLGWISLHQSVDFTAQALPGKTFSGKVSFIDPVIDPVTRIAKVRVEIQNFGRQLKPEMLITGQLHSKIKGNDSQLLIPQSAVLWTGKRSVVYVKIPGSNPPAFKMRKITLGNATNHSYQVSEGLSEGEEIVTNGTFSVDAAAQLAGKTSMMNPSEEKPSGKQNLGTMKMANDQASPAKAMFTVAGNCDMCKERIETAAKSVDGVVSAEWSAEKQMVHLLYDPAKTNPDEVQKAIAKVGHDTEKYKADDEVYSHLPECCLYKRLKY